MRAKFITQGPIQSAKISVKEIIHEKEDLNAKLFQKLKKTIFIKERKIEDSVLRILSEGILAAVKENGTDTLKLETKIRDLIQQVVPDDIGWKEFFGGTFWQAILAAPIDSVFGPIDYKVRSSLMMSVSDFVRDEFKLTIGWTWPGRNDRLRRGLERWEAYVKGEQT